MKRYLAVLAALTALGAILFGVAATLAGQQAEADRAAYEADRRAPAPAHFDVDGLTLSTGAAGEVVVTTDLSCPACQRFFADNGDRLRELVAQDFTVRLQVLRVREESAANLVALSVFVAAVQREPAQALDTYRTLSAAMQEVSDDAPEDEVRDRLAAALPASLRPSARAELSPETRRWLDARTYENRSTVGFVPAVSYLSEVYSGEDAGQAPDLSLE